MLMYNSIYNVIQDNVITADHYAFMLQNALDGGCTVSLRFDPFGKSAAQDALDMAIPVPAALLG